ncbi:MAG TPA: abhydrolase domain-containing 18 [Terriglobales bacterium]
MPSRYAQWMYDWETRLTSVDNNRVVRPLEWGLEWAKHWPCRNGYAPGEIPHDAEKYLREYNQRIIANSDEFYSYQIPSDFRLERREVKVHSTREVPDEKLERKVRGTYAEFLRFTSPVPSPYPENNLVNARWFPKAGRRAIVLLPHWNSDALAYNSLCRVFNWLGIAVLRLTMPYHDIRMPAEIRRADYAVSANIGRTLDATRQGVIDIRCCLDWLVQQGYKQLGVVGTSLGSCFAFLAAAHDPRIRIAAFNHASTYVSDVVWDGQSTRHIREGLEPFIDQERLRGLWSAISPMSYFRQFARWPKKSLIVYAKYDMTFLPELSRQAVNEFVRHGLDHRVAVLPCGHYTTGETPYKYMDGWQLVSFLRTAFDSI